MSTFYSFKKRLNDVFLRHLKSEIMFGLLFIATSGHTVFGLHRQA